jgi:hypothetical protein
VKHRSQAGKNEPRISTEGARVQPVRDNIAATRRDARFTV